MQKPTRARGHKSTPFVVATRLTEQEANQLQLVADAMGLSICRTLRIAIASLVERKKPKVQKEIEVRPMA